MYFQALRARPNERDFLIHLRVCKRGSVLGAIAITSAPPSATPTTTPEEWWYHTITEEIRAIVNLGGTPDFKQVDQLGNALTAAIPNATGKLNIQLARVAKTGQYAQRKPTIFLTSPRSPPNKL
jgi:hypothetical protein